jgi:hypothetical protein
MSAPPSERTKPGLSASLAGTLRLVGIGKLILASETLTLAFTGYETPRPVNGSFLLIWVNLLVLGWACLVAGRAFGRAAGEKPVPAALAEALEKTNKIFGYYVVLIGLAVLGIGIDLAMFLAKILGR